MHTPMSAAELTPTLTPALPIRRLHPEARIPSYQSEGAAGLDLSACLPGGPITLQPGEIRAIPTGLAMAIPQGFEGQVRPRSGLSTKHGMTCPNSPGTIDSDYRGELLVPMINLGREAFTVTHGLRIAQLVIAPVAHARLIEVQSLDDTARGEGGFGSTGLA